MLCGVSDCTQRVDRFGMIIAQIGFKDFDRRFHFLDIFVNVPLLCEKL
jgi:hypothetical protein